jgi:hypothetical protein
MGVLSYKLGKLSVPTTLLGPLAAYALFADRLLGTRTYSIPFAATGLLKHGKELLRIWDELPKEPNHDCELVDQWALGSGLTGWYKWIPYQP